eukprot:TRINITY_DN8821_c0_g1_i1.p2 TRINITY_DN8821_c0_g1~~TRINITY_DN8821_c0_g1_i1.p2  ORF type:complete len:105 (-),score=13.35 TRINITY_DN8821_c0_g1_i1:34-348(-)
MLPDGDRGGVVAINQQLHLLDEYFVQMHLSYVEFKIHVSVVSNHIQNAQVGLATFDNEADLIVSDVRALEDFIRKETAVMFNKLNSIWKLDGEKSLVTLPRFVE